MLILISPRRYTCMHGSLEARQARKTCHRRRLRRSTAMAHPCRAARPRHLHPDRNDSTPAASSACTPVLHREPRWFLRRRPPPEGLLSSGKAASLLRSDGTRTGGAKSSSHGAARSWMRPPPCGIDAVYRSDRRNYVSLARANPTSDVRMAGAGCLLDARERGSLNGESPFTMILCQ